MEGEIMRTIQISEETYEKLKDQLEQEEVQEITDRADMIEAGASRGGAAGQAEPDRGEAGFVLSTGHGLRGAA